MRAIFSKNPLEIPALNLELAERWKKLSEDDEVEMLDINAWRRHYEGRA
jgi:hypothetical protein